MYRRSHHHNSVSRDLFLSMSHENGDARRAQLSQRIGLHLVGTGHVIPQIVQQQREARYGLLRGYFHGADDVSGDEAQHERLQSVTLPAGSPWCGRRLIDVALHAMGVSVLSVRRAQGGVVKPHDELLLGPGDTLVLCGLPEPLALAEEKLLSG